LAAYLKAKYVVGETVASATRSALEIGGGHAIFKGGEIERLFPDGATATIMQPSSDVCLSALSVHELQLDREQIQSPFKLKEDR
jgi:alkylation response protein AidB-like acyl-CoA dehydrogenase